ncbi:MAG: endolytic transglycosylase MltG [Vicingaceae bacterium]
MVKRKRKKKVLWVRVLLLTFIILIAAAAFTAYELYRKVLTSNVVSSVTDDPYLYIPSNASFEEVCRILSQKGLVRNINTFIWVAEKKNYPGLVKSGRYKIEGGMSNNELINLLRSGEQEPIRLSYQNIRTLEELAGRVAKQIEADSLSLIELLRDESFTLRYGFNRNELLAMFIPNTYEFYWDTSSKEFFERMAREYKSFWTAERKKKAQHLRLNQTEVTTLASIVQAEQTIRPDERPRVAGLYINRIKKGMRLESDPTVIYALNDFTIKRVLNEDRSVDSPYNTYKFKGLPPGPINIPDISSIDAVLNYEKHDYLFMCAKEDFSGYHNFANNFRQHSVFAQRYRNELNKRKIYR